MGHENPVIVGVSRDIVCSTQLNVTTIEWFLVGFNAPLENTTEQELTFTLEPEDTTLNGAMLTCKVTTARITFKETVTIRVKGKLYYHNYNFAINYDNYDNYLELEHQVTTSAVPVSKQAGQRHTISCSSVADFPHTVSWISPDGTVITTDTATGVIVGAPQVSGNEVVVNLTFTSLTTSQAGQYTCRSAMGGPLSSAKSTAQDVIVISKLLKHENYYIYV